MAWDPDHYLRFADHRIRPGAELLARIPDGEPASVVDLGSGTGELTALLAERWPFADVAGLDSSAEMIARARVAHPQLTWIETNIAQWAPLERVHVIYSNAALHWLDDHATLFGRLRAALPAGGVLAVQMPDNWDEPTHTIPAEILDEGSWPDAARAALMRDRLAAPDDYAAWVQPASVDMWRTTYYHRLEGDDPVWTWVTGSVLRPVLAALDPAAQLRFGDECRSRYADAYPPAADGSTTLPFSRFFIVAGAE